MMPSKTLPYQLSQATDYLCIEHYLKDFNEVQFLKAAFSVGLIDILLEKETHIADLLKETDTDKHGLDLLIAILTEMQVICDKQEILSLTPRFKHALNYRDLLEAKIYFANMLAPDLLKNMHSFVCTPEKFMQESAVFTLFDYHKAIEKTEENYAFTAQWMHLTTILTRYESRACIINYNFENVSNMMDVGGNSGEFSLHITHSNPNILATVIDLPVVCEVGINHIKKHNNSQVTFKALNAITDELPKNQCLVTFKSMLHDWPIEACRRLFDQAYTSLRDGGEILIFEREKLDLKAQGIPSYGSIPTFLFFRSYREPEIYREHLIAAGFTNINIKMIILETPFLLITARKLAACHL